MRLDELLRYGSNFSTVLPLVIYLIVLRKSPRCNHYIGLLVFCSLITDLITLTLLNSRRSTEIHFNFFSLFQFALLTGFYYSLHFSQRNKIYLVGGTILFIVSLILVVSFIHDFQTYQSEMWAISSIIFVVYGLIYTNFLLTHPPLLNAHLYSNLIINGAVFVYFSFNFFLFTIGNYVLTEMTPDISRMSWAFHNFNNILKNIGFALGFYYTGKRKIPLTDEEVARIAVSRSRF